MMATVLFWISFVITIFAVLAGISVVRLSGGGVLRSFSWWLLAGICLFAGHHLMEVTMSGERAHDVSEVIEQLASVAFLIGAVLLTRTVRQLVR